MSRLDEIKARADVATPGPWSAKEGFTSDPMIEVYGQTVLIAPDLDGDPIQPEVWADAEFIAAAREDVPWLVSEVERLERWKAEALEVMSGLQELGKALGLGLGVQITGPAALAEVARLTAERDALAATVARVEALAGQQAITCHATNRWDDERGWLDVLAIIERTALAGSEADTSERDARHRCEPYYSRAECGQCGWQEQWCVTCSRQMCGCATDAMGADQ